MKRWFIIWLMSMPLTLAAQIEPQVEQWVEETDDTEAAAEWSDYLAELERCPLNLNDTLAFLDESLLTPLQKKGLRNYILLYGQLLSVDELVFVPGFDSAALAFLRPYVSAGPVVKPIKWKLSEGRHSLVTAMGTNVEPSVGYANGHYSGDSWRALAVYSYNLYNRLIVRLAADKDPGEEWGKNNYWTAHFELRDLGVLERLIVGRYNLQFGQGLTLWTGLRPFGYWGGTAIRFGSGVRPAGTFYERDYQQGVALRLRLAHELRLSAFGSKDDNERLLGAHLDWRHSNLVLGVTVADLKFDTLSVVREYVYNIHRFNSLSQTNVGADAMWQYGPLTLYGEASMNDSGAAAVVAGAIINMAGGSYLGLNARSLSRRYQNRHAQPYMLGSGTGESGICLDAATILPFGVRLVVSADLHRFDILRYASYAPSSGAWVRGQLMRSWGRVTASLRGTWRVKERNIPNLDTTAYLAEQTLREMWQAELAWNNRSLMFAARGVYSRFDSDCGSPQQGLMASFRMRYTFDRLQCTLAGALFNVEGYDARIYFSESNLQYAWSMPALNGKGIRTYALLRWRVSDHLSFGAKYALLWMPGASFIGSGDSRTEGPRRQSWMLQMRCRF